MPKNPITILLADDHPLTRAGIRATLEAEPDMRVVGEAGNGLEAQRLVAELKPDLLLLDLVMPDLRPAELARWVREHLPETTTIVLTAHDRDHYLSAVMEAGVAGLLDKKEESGKLVAGIRRAIQGESLFDQVQLSRAERWRKAAGEKWERLTPQERNVLHLIAGGLDNAAVGKALDISPKTAAFHTTNLLKKLETPTRFEAGAWLHKYLPEPE